LAELGFHWTENGNSCVRFPMDLEKDKSYWVDVWPYWGYPSGDYSTLHIRFYDRTNDTENIEDFASRLMILSSENRLRYKSKLSNIPYLIIQPESGQSYSMIYKNWKIIVSISRVEISKMNIDENNLRKSGLGEIILGVSSVGKSSAMSGMLIGSGIKKINAIGRNTPTFSKLGFTITVTKATDEDIYNENKILQKEAKDIQTKKNQNISVILIVLALVIGIPFIFGFLCIISSLLLSG
jgi:hypothetical protein